MAVRGASRNQDLLLDLRQVPGTFTGDFAVGVLNGRSRAIELGMAKISEEIG